MAATATLVGCLAGCGPSKTPTNELASSESWCPEGFEVGPQDTCFALPERHDKETPVLVYLHGMYTGHGSPEEWGLVHAAVDGGFAVVIPRGRRGLCAWKAELKDHFCWPSEPDDPQAFKSVVAEWERVLWQVDALLEGGQHKRYVLGFSNGGSFASYLADQGMFPASAWAIVNGGQLTPATKPAKATPMLLVSAEGDANAAPEMKQLHASLAKAGWPHANCARAGGHELSRDDLDAALRFFKRDASGALKTQGGAGGGSYACEPPTKAVP